MAKQTINIGSSVNKGDGDPLRTAFSKVNNNFDELYTALGLNDETLNLGAFEFNGSTLTTTDSTRIVVDQEVLINSDLTMKGNLLPNADDVHDLGSPDKEWRSLYVSENTIYLGGKGLGIDENNNLTINGAGVTVSTDWDAVTNKPNFFDGDYASLTNKPTIPVNLNDLSNVNTVDPVNGDFLMYANGEWVNAVLLNNIVAGSNISLLNNDAGYVTAADIAGGTLTVDVNNTGDLQGSVFADDSTLLVDGVAGTVPGTLTGNWTSPDNFFTVNGAGFTVNSTTNTALSISDFGLAFTNSDDDSIALTLGNGSFGLSGDGSFSVSMETLGINIGSIASIVVGSDLGISIGGDVNLAATNINLNGTTNGTFNGDITGSVFADDSTLLVDGANGSIPYSVLSGAPSFGNWTFSSNTLSENSTGNAVIQSSTFAGSKLILQTRGPTDKQWIFDQDGDLTAPGDITMAGMLTVEESFSSTPTTKFFEIETGAGNNRLLRTGVNMSAFAQNIGPEIGLTSYRSSPANGDAGPELVLRASTGASANDVIATIGTQVTDITDGDVTSKILFTVQNNGSNVTPFTIAGSTVDMQTADQVSISNENGAVDIYGGVEFNNGTTAFQAGNNVDFNCPVNFTNATVTGLSLPLTSLTNDSGDVIISTTSPSGDDVRIQTVDDIELFAGDDIVIYTNYNSGSDKLFVFRSEGDIEFPDGTRQSTAWTGEYTPTTSSDWNTPAPTTIAEAIDRLAAVVKTLNSGTGA